MDEDRQRVAELFGLGVDSAHLEEALTHPSFANENGVSRHNQRFEFLGDAVLQLCCSEILWRQYPDADEGRLTRMRAQLVNASALATWARQHRIADAILLGRGAEAGNLRESSNVMADAVEALIAATYLEGGLPAAQRACRLVIQEGLREFERGTSLDAKTELQERVQATRQVIPRYSVEATWGPPHERQFRVVVALGNQVIGRGEGKSKRAAEQQAAKEALEHAGTWSRDAQESDETSGMTGAEPPKSI